MLHGQELAVKFFGQVATEGSLLLHSTSGRPEPLVRTAGSANSVFGAAFSARLLSCCWLGHVIHVGRSKCILEFPIPYFEILGYEKLSGIDPLRKPAVATPAPSRVAATWKSGFTGRIRLRSHQRLQFQLRFALLPAIPPLS